MDLHIFGENLNIQLFALVGNEPQLYQNIAAGTYQVIVSIPEINYTYQSEVIVKSVMRSML